MNTNLLLMLSALVILGLGGCASSPVCGDGVVDPGEACDGPDLGDATCASLGWAGGGTLACSATCSLEISGCQLAACGNGVVDPGEVCDGSDLGGATCVDLGFHEGGSPACTAACSLDSSGCTGGYCGDLVINGAESCDGPDLSAVTCLVTCADFGFYEGELGCATDCALVPTGCFGACGDGVLNGPEACDGSDLGSATCAGLGYLQGGELKCADDCTLDVSGCMEGACGDGKRDLDEVCDGTDLGGQTCASIGYHDGGDLGCTAACTLDTSGCLGSRCGDGVLDPGEACDGADLGGATCADLGLFDGSLACDDQCGLDASGCLTAWTCGDLLVDARNGKSYRTVALGGLCWMADNLDVGTRIELTLPQADNGLLEKYCYGNDAAMCDAFGGLYQWSEAMQYVDTAGAVGICPAGFRLPTDAEWKALEIAAGMAPATADLDQWRGPPAGVVLQVGGSSGFDALLGGAVTSIGASFNYPTYGYYWTSTLGTSMPWRRCFTSGPAYAPDTIGRWETWPRGYALSIRCVTGP